MPFPEKFLDLFEPETKAFLFLSTVNAKGQPQVSPVCSTTMENISSSTPMKGG